LNSKCEASEKASVRILLVDDFEQFRTLVSSILTKQPGYQVVGEAADGLEGVLLAKELKPDLVVLDMQLPKLNGIEVARQIRRCSPDSTILFLTGNSDPELVREALLASALGYVLKFDTSTDLAEAAKTVISGKRFVSRTLRNKGVTWDC
jgi:DNA-binding NarL/FixJ family response regulator